MTLPIGNYKAVALAETAEFSETPTTKTPYLEVTFRVLDDGEHKDKEMRKTFFLSDKAAKYAIPELRVCGCTFPGGDITNLEGLGTREVEIVVQKQKPKEGETDSKYTEIRFINDPNRKREVVPIDEAKKSDLKSKLRGAILATEEASALKATGTSGTKPPF